MNRIKIVILIQAIFLFANFADAYSQTVTGTVVDFTSLLPVAGVRIQIRNEDTGQVDTTFTNAQGNWSYSLILSAITDGTAHPDKFIVNQNFPNPFNPTTKIRFSVFEPGEIQITVHNLLGQRVDEKRLYLGAGNYQVSWESRGAAGVYFYTITIADESVTKKMLQLDNGVGGGLGVIHHGSDLSHDLLFKITATPLTIIASKSGYIADTLKATISGGEHFQSKIETVHHHATVIDLHNDIIYQIAEYGNYHLADLHSFKHTDIPRLIQGGVDIQFFALWVNNSTYPNNSYQRVLDYVATLTAEVQVSPNEIALARTASEALAINVAGKIAGVMAVEGGHVIENSIDKLIYLKQLGMCYMTITWNNSTEWAISALDSRSRTVGLSEFGKKVIRTMDSLGVIIDVSHTGIKTIQDILAISKNPIIASHSGVRRLREHTRNLYDEQIKAIASTGGVIGVVFYPSFLAPSGTRVDIATVMQHIDYIVNLVGIDYVAIGSDFDGIEQTPIGLENTSKFPNLTLALLQHGYSRTDVEKILGGNFLRVFHQVCGGVQVTQAKSGRYR